jgi:D-beta-D-heptose 7-phosphate kinase/D-beta-D-heptose 1-phosphate adenosyltransferase
MKESVTTLQQTSFSILLIGDSCIDEYQYGLIERLSPEAPVPVFQFLRKEVKPGMAANVKANLEAFGCKVNFLTGEQSTKTRLIDSRSKQHIVRIDNDVISQPISIDSEIPDIYDAIVISDYNKGTVSYELIEELIELSIPIFIDTKKTDLERMQGAWVKINELEYSKIKSECSGLIVTRGSRGATAIHHDIDVSAPNVEVVDVCGAGDTFLAALVCSFLNTQDIEQAITFANHAAGKTVQHSGVYALTEQDITDIYASINNRS